MVTMTPASTARSRRSSRPRAFRRRTSTVLNRRPPWPVRRRVVPCAASVISSPASAAETVRVLVAASAIATPCASHSLRAEDRHVTRMRTFRVPLFVALAAAAQTVPRGSHVPCPSHPPIVQLSSGKHGIPLAWNVGVTAQSLRVPVQSRGSTQTGGTPPHGSVGPRKWHALGPPAGAQQSPSPSSHSSGGSTTPFPHVPAGKQSPAMSHVLAVPCGVVHE